MPCQINSMRCRISNSLWIRMRGLRRQLRETQRLGAVGNGGNTEHGIRSPYTELGYPQAPRFDLSMPFSDASRNGGETGGNERGEAPFWEPVTMSIYRNDVTTIFTKIERFFPGSAWSEILQDHENELRQTFMREAAQALGVPEDKLQHVSMEPNPQGLFATVKVPHSSDTSAEELKRPLKTHPFVPVLNLYGAALANKNERLKEALIQAHNENQSASRSMQDNPKTKTDGPSAIMDKNEEMAHLSNEIDSVKRQNVRLQKELKKINEQLAAREAPSRINAQEEYDALKSFVDNSLKPLISRLKRTNGEKELDLRANEERIRQLLHDKEQLQKQLAAREAPSRINAQEEYDALKSFVDNSLKPLISRLKRTNGEKELDLRANEERIRQLLHDKEQLQKQLAAREAPSRINAQEEYDALKSFVDNSLKPLISRLKRTNGEKELDLRANEERIRQLLHDKEQLQKQLAAREAPSRINAQEEYDALKSFVDNSLKPLISRLKRTNGEKELDLRANEERIRQLLHDKEQLQKQLAAREAPSRINAQEEYDALKSFVDNSLKPLISRLERTNGEKELDLRANEERIRQLLSKCGRSCSLYALNTGAFSIHSEGMKSDRHVLLDALVEAEESARVRESDLLALVDSLQNVVDRYVVEKEKLVARLETLNGELSEALKERDMAMSDGKLLEEECAALRDQLRGELLAQIPVGEQRLLAAYLDEVQRRREVEKEMYRGLSKRVKASW
ncbi:Flagellum attachment zone protein 6 [Trypanosoma cruzi]|uniref:Flagellum attachment zone protein 6 n=1 Tax=Trypanosoma cruzi TaxID=5693 RepID=A0A2V2UNN2_TRYCR|nr:Flagellum attachment zone protein 6 [Trypanosoma cruzi]